MYLTVAILIAFIVTFVLLPIIIKVSTSIDLLDAPDVRKIHSISTPSLGGIAIFSGFILATLIALPLLQLMQLKFLLSASVVIFILGIRDDISSLHARHKLFIQLFSAFLVVYVADIRLAGLYGMLGINEMPEWFNISFTMFAIIALTNAFNLIDGIDGLAACVGILVLSVFGSVFLSLDQLAYGIVCLSLVGALVAFLFFNWHPSKVFMGDTGSMVLGFTVSAMSIEFINLSGDAGLLSAVKMDSTVAICISLLILPVYDTLRVFTIRFMNGKNPLDPDRNHLHHGLLELGMSHSQATITMISTNLLIFGTTLLLDRYFHNGELLLVVFGLMILICSVLEIKLYYLRFARKSIKVTHQKDLYLSKSA